MRRWYTVWLVVLLLSVPFAATANSGQDLITAARDSDIQAVRAVLDQAVDVNTTEADGTTALHWAALRDDLEIARLLLLAEAKASPTNDYGVTPLSLACTNRSASMVELLLRAGADPNAARASGETVLMNCARTGAVDAVAALIAVGADVNAAESTHGQTALMWAAAEGHPGVTQLLLEHGAEFNAVTIETEPTLSHSCRVCEWKPAPGGFTALMFAARSGDLESARLLVTAGADPDPSHPVHGSALVIASAGGHERLALYLLEAGADPDSADETGITALHHAVGEGLSYLDAVTYDPVYRQRPENSLPLARALLQAGANPDARIQQEHIRGPDSAPFGMVGATPLLLAATSADVPMLRLMQEFAADPHIKTETGVTPLMAAAQAACTGTCAYQGGGHDTINPEAVLAALEAVKLVAEMGIDVNAADKDGRTAMHVAAFTGADAVVQFLADRGAQLNVLNNRGESPWSMASGISPEVRHQGIYGKHESTAALLVELGAEKIVPPSDDEFSVSGGD